MLLLPYQNPRLSLYSYKTTSHGSYNHFAHLDLQKGYEQTKYFYLNGLGLCILDLNCFFHSDRDVLKGATNSRSHIILQISILILQILL
jgi:hypothetical protein